MKRNQYKNEYTEEQRAICRAKAKIYREKKSNEYPGYAVYYIPEEHYVGISKNISSRMTKHKHLGKIIDGWEVLMCFENPIRAHLMETQLHLMGYNGYRPLMGYKKKSQIDMGNYTASPSEFNAFKWCIDNGIYIAPKANTTLDWYICITMNGKSSMSPSTYKKIDVWKQMYRFYLYYYNKYNNDIKIEPMLVIPKKETKVKQQSNDNQLF